MPFRPLALTVLLLLLLPLAASCSPDAPEDRPAQPAQEQEQSTPVDGGALVTGTIGDASNLLPALSSDAASGDIIGLVYNGLVKTDKNLNIVGDLAESWEISEDGLTITFHLRKGVTWHDGEPFTSRDALFTYQLMVDPKTPTAYGEDFKQVVSAQTPDEHTFRVSYARPFAPALLSWAFPVMPAHLLEGRDITKSELSKHPVGTGPYVFKQWETGQRIVLTANENYFEGRPHISRYIWRVIPDQATMFLELKSGGLDMMGLTPIQYTRQTQTKEFKASYNKYKYLSFGYTYLGFNLRDEKFKDQRVRQAISYAIDKEEIIQGVLLGLGQPANGPYKPGSWAYNEKVTPYPFDPDRARALLAEAGWADTDGDGLLDKDGQAFSFTIITNQGNDQRQTTALIIQQRLKALGLEVKVRVIEWAAFLKEFVDKKNFEAIILGWTIPINPDLYDVWHSSKNKPGELNHISYANAEVDRLLDQARFTFDRGVQKAAYDRIQEILKEDAPYVFLYVPESLPAVSSRFRGIEPAPAGITYNLAQWWTPPSLRKYRLEP